MRAKTRLVIATMCAAVMALPVAALGTSADDTKWTVLMYFGADNDLYEATQFGLEQAEIGLDESGVDADDLSVVVLIDGPLNKDTKVYDLTAADPADRDQTANAFGSANVEKMMTAPETMVEFLTWGMKAYPADYTMLILKNGHAWCGILPEDDDGTNEKLLMPIEDIAEAIGEVYADPTFDAWVDVIVFDGDNMGSIEVAYELRAVTDYFVGSQQQVPFEGLPYYLFMKDLGAEPGMSEFDACKKMVDDYVLYYNNTDGKKNLYPKLLSNSQMYVTAAVYQMGPQGAKIQAVVDAFDNYLDYMLYGELPSSIKTYAIDELGLEHVEAKLAQWNYTLTTGELVWAWIPLSRNNISSARDCALIGKMNDQQGYEWLPDTFTWLRSISALVNYDAYGDSIPPSGDTPIRPDLDELKDPFVRLLLEDFMVEFGYIDPGIYRSVWRAEDLTGDGALVWVSQSQILDRSGNSFPHGLNIWFPPSWLQWDEGDAWSDLFNKPMTYTYSGIGVWLGGDEVILLPAEYYCIDCPVPYDEIGLDFTADTLWMDFFEIYYDSRWLIYGGDTGGHDVNKP